MIDDKQCVMIWYIDDIKISDMSESVVKNIINKLKKRFGKMTVNFGPVCDFIGIKMRFLENRTLEVDMRSYLEEAVVDFDEGNLKPATTPAKLKLFSIDDDSLLVNEEDRVKFHSIMMKLMCASYHRRKDMQLVATFLAGRVNCCAMEDYGKLRRLICYIIGAMDLLLYLGMDDCGKMINFIDASFACRDDFKSQTGGCSTFGTGMFSSDSKKQKINTKSSTEAEVVGLADRLPRVVHHQLFMDAQGYTLYSNVLLQDNQAAIRMECNGKMSCSKRSRHMNIRYFYVKDLVDRKEVEVEYCPTERMVADFFTKPLQGTLFIKFRDVIMGSKPVSSILIDDCSSPKERVEPNKEEPENCT